MSDSNKADTNKNHKNHFKKISESLSKLLIDFYDKKYLLLLIIPVLILLASIAIITNHYIKTGDFMYRDVSLKGGASLKVNDFSEKTADEVQLFLDSKFGREKTTVRELSELGKRTGLTIDSSDIKPEEIRDAITKEYNIPVDNIEINTIGSSLGASFFTETIKALFIAFIFMGCVVFLYFGTNTIYKIITVILSLASAVIIFNAKTAISYAIAAILFLIMLYLYMRDSIPSAAVILAAFCDILATWAVTILLGIHIGIAGIAAFLMLIGYSVDTDILLTTRVLRRKEQSILEATLGAMKTGLTMSIAAMAAVLVAFYFTASPVIKQIMIILFIGLIFDIINTWLQNAAILRWHLEKKKHYHGHEKTSESEREENY